MNLKGGAIQLHIGRGSADLLVSHHRAVGNKLDGFGVVGQLSMHVISKSATIGQFTDYAIERRNHLRDDIIVAIADADEEVGLSDASPIVGREVFSIHLYGEHSVGCASNISYIDGGGGINRTGARLGA